MTEIKSGLLCPFCSQVIEIESDISVKKFLEGWECYETYCKNCRGRLIKTIQKFDYFTFIEYNVRIYDNSGSRDRSRIKVIGWNVCEIEDWGNEESCGNFKETWRFKKCYYGKDGAIEEKIENVGFEEMKRRIDEEGKRMMDME